jgi:hypothetical protein
MSATTDKVPVVCPNCNKRLLVPAGTLGKQGRCPACQTVFTLEQLWEAEPVQSAPAPSPFGPPTSAAGFAPAANPWGAPAPSQPAKSPFSDDDFTGDYNLQAAPPLPQSNFAPPTQFTPVSGGFSGSYSPPRKKERTWDSSVLGGIAMMVIAVVWFVGGLAVDIIFFYPPILFIIGLIALVKGLFAGNLAGD